jgi:hypothetical protein
MWFYTLLEFTDFLRDEILQKRPKNIREKIFLESFMGKDF